MIEFFQFSLNLHCSWKIIENNYQYINTSSIQILILILIQFHNFGLQVRVLVQMQYSHGLSLT